MKKIFSSQDSAEVGLLKSMLQSEGIDCYIRNEYVDQAIPSAPFQPELWIANDEDFSKAQDLYKVWRAPYSVPGETWTCSRCGEQLEAQFESCWKCGAPRD
jgi:hypothetical protein